MLAGGAVCRRRWRRVAVGAGDSVPVGVDAVDDGVAVLAAVDVAVGVDVAALVGVSAMVAVDVSVGGGAAPASAMIAAGA